MSAASVPVFPGKVSSDGKVKPHDIGAFYRHVRTLAGEAVDIIVQARRRQRSLDQNAYLHAEPFPKLAKEWGESVARTKLICMGEFWGWEPCKVSGSVLPVKAHTSDMSVPECTLFIDWLLPWALTEHGVDVQPPQTWHERQMERAA